MCATHLEEHKVSLREFRKTAKGSRTSRRTNYARAHALSDLAIMFPGEYEALRQAYANQWEKENPQ